MKRVWKLHIVHNLLIAERSLYRRKIILYRAQNSEKQKQDFGKILASLAFS